jgi:hypothetical protein
MDMGESSSKQLGAGQLNNDTRIDKSRGVLTRAMKSLLFDAMEGEIGESGEFNTS